jgi:HD superfamily phosphohydrolase
MPAEAKVVHDAVHGSVVFTHHFQDILNTPEMQRAGQIHQLGLANLVFPGANHTRLEHMIGTFYLATRFGASLELKEHERLMLLASALLHDIGHPAFSHTFETLIEERLHMNHMEITASIIKGEFDILPEGERKRIGNAISIPECLEALELSPREVASVVVSEHGVSGLPPYITSLIHGPVDVDQMDYLMRDSHYTGVAPGRVDADRIIQTSEIKGKRMVIRRGGIPAIEGLIVSRILMNTAVYFHKTVRIAELMLTRAVESLGREELSQVIRDTDASLMCRLAQAGGYAADIALRLKYRRLLKPSLVLSIADMSEEQRKALAEDIRRKRIREMEREISSKAGLQEGYVLIDTSHPEYIEGKDVKGKTEVPILDDNGKIVSLTKLSSIASAIQRHPRQEYAVLVACEERHRERVRQIAKRVLF